MPYPVDVRVINDAPLPFRYNVSRGQRIVVNDDECFYAFLERIWDEYFDFEPVLLQYLRDLRMKRIDPIRVRDALSNVGEALRG